MSQQINLFNPVFLKRKKPLSALAMVQAMGLILLGCLGLAAYLNFQVSVLKQQAARSTSLVAATQAQLIKVSTELGQRQKSKVLEEEIVNTEDDLKSLQRVFELLKKGEFGNTKGFSEYLRAFSRQSPGGLWLTGLTITGAGHEIGLQGRVLQADLVPAFIGRLKQEPAMHGKSFSSLEMNAPQPDALKGDSVKLKTIMPAGFVEFRLQSSEATGEQAGLSGAPKR